MADELQEKLQEMSENQAKRCLKLNFAEPSIETSFRTITFANQCRNYRIAAAVLCLALAALSAQDFREFQEDHHRYLATALAMRGISICLLLAYCLVTYSGRRIATLALTVLTVWVVMVCYIVVRRRRRRRRRTWVAPA